MRLTKYDLCHAVLKFVAFWPLPVMYVLSDIAYYILHRVIKYRLPVVRKNIRMAFPEKSEKELRHIERKFYSHFCDVFVEAAKLAHISDSEIDRRVRATGVEHINSAVCGGKSVVLLIGHFGNWEWVTALARHITPGVPLSQIYHEINSRTFNRLMLDLRSRFGTENILMSHTYRRLLEINRAGLPFVCGFISDQRPFTTGLKHWTDFLGIDTAYVNGGEVIGRKLEAEILYVECRPERRGHYVIEVSPITPLDDGEENPYTRAYLKLLERSIRRNPAHWLWSHNRWKHRRSTGNVHVTQ